MGTGVVYSFWRLDWALQETAARASKQRVCTQTEESVRVVTEKQHYCHNILVNLLNILVTSNSQNN